MSSLSQAKLVSVIVPVYNREYLIIQSLESVFNQTYRPIELIVVDDGSIDNTVSLIKSWWENLQADNSFELIIIEKNNSGAPSARNVGIQESSGSYVQFFDSDDILDKSKLEIQVGFLIDNEDVDYVYSRARVFSNKLGDTNKFIGSEQSKTIYGHTGAHALKTDLGIYRRDILDKMGFWKEDMKVWQEGEYNLRLFTNKAKVEYIPKILTNYRVQGNDRISTKIAHYKYIQSLQYMEDTAKAGLDKLDLQVFYDSLASRYFSVFIHSIKNKSYNIATKSALSSFMPAIYSKKKIKVIKSMFTIAIALLLPKNLRHYLVNRIFY